MRVAPHEPDASATDRTGRNPASRKGIGPSLTRPARGAQMRTLVALLLLGVPTAIAAPVPKELRRQSVAGTKPGDTAGGIKFAIDPKTQPKSFDWICPWGEWYGVCELKDDTFTIYIKGHGKNGGEKVRPAQLNIGPGIEMYSFQRSTAVK